MQTTEQTYTIRCDRPYDCPAGLETLATVPLSQVRDALAALADCLPSLDIGQAPAIIEVRRVS